MYTTWAAIGSIIVLYSAAVAPGGGTARSGYSAPPIQIAVNRPAIAGSSSQADASSVSPAPKHR